MTKLDEITKKVEGLAAAVNAEFLQHVKDRDRETLEIIVQVSWGVARAQHMMECDIEDGADDIARMCRISKLRYDIGFPLWKLEQLGITSPLASEIMTEAYLTARQALAFYPAHGKA